jgi:ABC-type transporter Mla MlaB component
MDALHYTQLPSELHTACDLGAAVAHVRGGGFLTREMVDATLDQWRHAEDMPACVLIDLRDVAGYEAGCAAIAHEFLRQAQGHRLRRIAFVATSSVLRTAAQLVAPQADVRVRVFADASAAQHWLARPDDSVSA